MTSNGNGTSHRGALRVLYNVAVYTAILAFCVGVWFLIIWLYLDHPVWAGLLIVATVTVVVACCWDDLHTGRDPDPEPERPRLRRVV